MQQIISHKKPKSCALWLVGVKLFTFKKHKQAVYLLLCHSDTWVAYQYIYMIINAGTYNQGYCTLLCIFDSVAKYVV